MTYQRERDEFLNIIQNEGMSYQIALKMMRYAQTLHRLAVAQCNGDWPADNGEREVIECPRCGSGFAPSAFRRSHEVKGEKVCVDCRTAELVRESLPEGYDAKIGGDPRGAVLKLRVPSGRTNDWGREGICVPVRER